MNKKFTEWCSELKILSKFAASQPQAAYGAFCLAEQNKFSYFLRTIPKVNYLLKTVDEIVQFFYYQQLLVKQFLKKERELYTLPVQSGGLGIPLFREKTCNELENLFTITALLVAYIINQDTSHNVQ